MLDLKNALLTEDTDEFAREVNIPKLVQVMFYSMIAVYVKELGVLPKLVGDFLEEALKTPQQFSFETGAARAAVHSEGSPSEIVGDSQGSRQMTYQQPFPDTLHEIFCKPSPSAQDNEDSSHYFPLGGGGFTSTMRAKRKLSTLRPSTSDAGKSGRKKRRSGTNRRCDVLPRVLEFLNAIPNDDVSRTPPINHNSMHKGASHFQLNHQWIVKKRDERTTLLCVEN
ncbi:hypothetical protein Cgig2_031627 [Carnegiea gigantea]|uniref:Uncharacterized protein n=1 Tax=Carnegiea gigantea TaxID=171969 RepID=A0A9Q1K983_9CARY|nr:hypothetical protein Cgig2_031627 [Carnegiea gigantea]